MYLFLVEMTPDMFIILQKICRLLANSSHKKFNKGNVCIVGTVAIIKISLKD
jgi:hypothetical protein